MGRGNKCKEAGVRVHVDLTRNVGSGESAGAGGDISKTQFIEGMVILTKDVGF